MFKPRPKQAEVLQYTSGWMGVSAVPGAGKTRTLSELAAKLLAEAPLAPDQEVLVVTLVNSAVGNFSRQIGVSLKARGLLPGFGYRVRTLHALANDIVRERPELVGLGEGFNIIDERETNAILDNAVHAMLGQVEGLQEDYILESFLKKSNIAHERWGETVKDCASAFIRQAKDALQTPQEIEQKLSACSQELPLARLCNVIYARYQDALQYRVGIDFQDMVRLAYQALLADAGYLERLRHRWVYILEDEAQDSDSLQERILALLAGERGNWIRVGDPNQAIYETFTTANPRYLREFMVRPGVAKKTLPNSGRSAVEIIRVANHLIDWSLQHHDAAIRERQPLSEPYIEPAPAGDPQPNPTLSPDGVTFVSTPFTSAEELNFVLQTVQRTLTDDPTLTVSILTPRNKRGFDVVERLKQAKIPHVELLKSTVTTREAAGSLVHILNYLAKPDASLLARVYRVFNRDFKEDADTMSIVDRHARVLVQCAHLESFLYGHGKDWLAEFDVDPETRDALAIFREQVRELHEAVWLPIDQLILTVAQRLFTRPADLAIAYALSMQLRQDGLAQELYLGGGGNSWNLEQYTQRLKEIATNERKFLGMDEESRTFNPDHHKGVVTVATLHSAKGLEWDHVCLMSINNYDFPSNEPHDSYQGEKYFIRDRLNLQSETLAQFHAVQQLSPYHEGHATLEARADYASERLRLLYVGLTRARRQLTVTWNTGRMGESREATPLLALRTWWEATQTND